MHRWLFLLAAASLVQAQTPSRLLTFVPASVEGIELYPRPAQAKERLVALVKAMGEEAPGSLVLDAGVLGFDPDGIPGAVLVARNPVKTEGKKPAKEKPQETLLIASDPGARARLKALGATQGKAGWTYTLKGSRKTPRYAAVSEGFLLVATSQAFLQAALEAGRKPAPDPGVPLSWIEGQDAVFMPTAKGVKAFFQGFRKGVTEGKKQQAEAETEVMARALTSAVGRLETSTAGMALGVSFDPQSPSGIAQLFLKPGSPLAQDFARLSPVTSSLFSQLAGDGYALAMGFSGGLGAVFEPLVEDIQKALMAKPGAEAAWKAYLETSRAQTRAMVNTAWSLAAPQKKGDPALSQLVGVTHTTDAKAYLERMVALQGQMATLHKEAGLAVPVPEVTRETIPGTPSATFTYDLQASLGKGKANPQTFMAFTLLLGDARPAISTAVLDEKTLVTVVGGAARLQAELDRQKAGPALAQDLGVAATSRQLGALGGMDMLISLKGMANLVRTVGESLGGPVPSMPALPDVPPFGVRLRVDAAGVALVGTAPMETLKAAVAAGKSMKPAEPKGGAEE